MFEIALHKAGPVPSLLKRELNNCHRDAMRWAGEFWHRNFREKHFTNAGSTEYNYTPRSGEPGSDFPGRFAQSYTGRKLKKFGHTRPLEYKGESRRRTRSPRIVATAKRGEASVRVVMDAPGLNRRYAGSQINMRAELVTISAGEAPQIVAQIDRFLAKRYLLSYRKTTRFS
jgi:hypothetical protein